MTQTKTKNGEITRAIDQVGVAIGIILFFNLKILWQGLRRIKFSSPWFINTFIITLGIAVISAQFNYHLKLIYWQWPETLSYLERIRGYGFWNNLLGLWAIIELVILWFAGIVPSIRFRRYQNALDLISLKNAKEQTPKVVAVFRTDEYHEVVKIWASGIGAELFKKNKSRLESSFEKEIEEIRPCKNRSYVEIVLSTKELPAFVDFKDMEKRIEDDGHFLLGESKKGVVSERISKLPHMLIAGSTGSGKSQCFKQILLALLKSTPKLQMYLIDLKGGIEFREFGTLPNVKMVKTIDDAVTILEAVKEEMENRFDYIAEKGISKLDLKKDKFDRIIVGIDESSVLYANAKKDSDDYELIVQARELTEHIAKLSRVSGISLILATQKVTKETIDTRIQENISGRMCFKLNTPEGSVRVLGNGAANHLDAIPGRGIWQFGNEQVEVQVPHLDADYLKEKLEKISQEFTEGKRKLHRKLLNIDSSSSIKNTALKNSIRKEVNVSETTTEI